MFGYCIWYAIFNKNIINIINSLSITFKTENYQPHITYLMNLDKNKAEKIFNDGNINTKDFCIKGYVYQTCLNNFYALQQDFIDENNKLYHISLAYRNFKKFTNKELILAQSMINFNKINKKDIKILLYNCDSRFQKNWKKIQ